MKEIQTQLENTAKVKSKLIKAFKKQPSVSVGNQVNGKAVCGEGSS